MVRKRQLAIPTARPWTAIATGKAQPSSWKGPGQQSPRRPPQEVSGPKAVRRLQCDSRGRGRRRRQEVGDGIHELRDSGRLFQARVTDCRAQRRSSGVGEYEPYARADDRAQDLGGSQTPRTWMSRQDSEPRSPLADRDPFLVVAGSSGSSGSCRASSTADFPALVALPIPAKIHRSQTRCWWIETFGDWEGRSAVFEPCTRGVDANILLLTGVTTGLN
jgi:hypothetical protein